MEKHLIILSGHHFWWQFALGMFGFAGVLAYYFYFKIRIKHTQEGKPPKGSNMALLNTLVGIPTAWIWFILPLMPQPRFDSVISLFKGKTSLPPLAILTSIMGFAVIIFAAYYLAVVEKENLRVTQKNYTAPESMLTTGVYGMVRHPIVTFTTFLLLGICLLTGASFTLLLIPVFFMICFLTSVIEERFALRLNFPDEFFLYKKSTPAYFNGWLALLLVLLVIIIVMNYAFITVT